MIESEQLLQKFANLLSTITILSCLFLKVPQIINIRKNKSAKGIYVPAMMMEISAFTIVALYNYTNKYSIMTYMEYPIILIQLYAMLYYVLKYNESLDSPIVPAGIVLYIGTVIGYAWNLMSTDILSVLVPFCTPLSGFAKVTYIYGIISCGNADAVALQTWIISVLTNLSRLFTIYVDSADVKLMFNYVVSTLLSSGVLLTALYYKASSSPTSSYREGKRQEKSSLRQRKHCHEE